MSPSPDRHAGFPSSGVSSSRSSS